MKYLLKLIVSCSLLLAGNTPVRSPILFEPNRGQASGSALFVAQATGFRLLLDAGGAVFDFGTSQGRLDFAGKGQPGAMTGESSALAVRNYIRDADPKRWILNVPTFEKVRYSGLLPGIDAVFHSRQGLEFDFEVGPGADPSLIDLRYSGFRAIEISPDGSLLLRGEGGVVQQHAPGVFQDGRKIAARYVRRGSGSFGIEVGSYDAERPLLVDPKLSYATYWGGSGGENLSTVTVDPAGNYYLAAYSTSADFPTAPARPGRTDQDLVISKFSSTDTLLYTTQIGGTGTENTAGAVADADGSLFVGFSTASQDFPRPANSIGGTGAGTGVFKLGPTGTPVAMAFWSGAAPAPALGLPNNSVYAVALDGERNVWVTGTTLGFSGQNGALQANAAGGQDIFVARLNNSLSQVGYFTYLGSAADEAGNSIAVDSAGSVYVAGNGGSSTFPTGSRPPFPAAPGAFVVKLSPSTNRVLYATYLTSGGGGRLVLDGADVWACGNSSGANFTPTPDAVQPLFGGGINDVMLARLNAADGAVRYATYFGGAGNEFANALVQDPFGNVTMFGNSTSKNLKVTPDAVQPAARNGGATTTAFLVQFDAGAAVVYASYLGGTGAFDIGLTAAVDRRGNLILAGATQSTDFPVTANALQKQYGGAQDDYIVKVEFAAGSDPSLARDAIQNAASFRPGAIAPGEILTIYPANAGPAALVTAALTPERRIATLIGGTRVLFDDIPAPMVYAVNGQVSLVAPYSIKGKSFTRIVVEYNGVKSRPVVAPVTTVAPGILTLSGGSGPAVALNQDGKLNSADSPAERGSIIVLYATGEGETNPSGVDGRLNEFDKIEDFPRSLQAVKVTIGGQDADVLFAAGAPGFLAGLMQLNLRVPAGVQAGASVPVVLSVGTVASPPVTVAVR